MAYTIQERFEVNAPVDAVWKFLNDPERVVVCLPGAALDEVVDERNFRGHMTVKVGPVTVIYNGQVEFADVDEAAHRIRLVGKGREKGGAGSAKMTMESHLAPLPTGGAEVVVEAKVDLVGRLASFGRGMITEVSAQLFRDFAGSVKQSLEGGAPGEAALATRAGKPLRALPLLLRALFAPIARLFRRLFRSRA